MSDETKAPEFDYDATVAEIKKLQQSNMGKVQSLLSAGRSIDAGAVADLKIDTFIRLFLDKNAQAMYVLELEKGLAAMLNEGLNQIRQEVLTQGVTNKKPGLIVAR